MISGKYLFDANDVLYSKIRPYLRKVVMAGSPGLCSSDIYPLKVAEGEILAEFLKWRLLAADFTAYADAESRRARMPKLNRDQLFSWAFALPPLSEQRQVVNRLCAQLAAVARARAAAEARLAATKALGACHLRNAFNSGEATHWPRVPLRSLAEIVSGVTLGRKLPSAPLRAVPYVTVANVKDGNLDLANVRTIAVSEVEIAKWRLRQGDLLLTEGGDPDKLGRGTFWDGQIPECIHQNHIFRVRFDLTLVSPAFASAQFGSPYGKDYFLRHAKQTTGIATINQRVLGDFPFLLPPIETQEAVVERLRKEMTAAESVRAAAEAELAAINALPAALLRRAFSGEL